MFFCFLSPCLCLVSCAQNENEKWLLSHPRKRDIEKMIQKRPKCRKKGRERERERKRESLLLFRKKGGGKDRKKKGWRRRILAKTYPPHYFTLIASPAILKEKKALTGGGFCYCQHLGNEQWRSHPTPFPFTVLYFAPQVWLPLETYFAFYFPRLLPPLIRPPPLPGIYLPSIQIW